MESIEKDASLEPRPITRRQFLKLGATVSGAVAAGALLASCGTQGGGGGTAGSGGQKSAELNIGFVPNSALGAIVSMYMRDNELVQKRAEELGTNVQVEWQEFPGAPPEIQAMIAGDLDIAGTGFVPTSRAILEGQDLHFLSIYEGKLDVWLAAGPDSSIHSVQDLEGKTVGTFIGGDIQFFLTQLLNVHLGSPIPADHGINAVNVPSGAAMERMPSGVDAVTPFGPNYLSGKNNGTLVGLVSNQGHTGDAWTGETPPAEFQESPFYPEAYMFHRADWAARGDVIRDSPDLIEAHLLAQQDAIRELREMEPAEVAAIAEDAWGIPGEIGATIVENDLLWGRPWTWWTEGDLNGLAKASELEVQAGVVEEAITLDQLIENMSIVAPIAKRAYERINYPDLSEFTAENTSDIRGKPFWDLVE